jgi:hypothetical protein
MKTMKKSKLTLLLTLPLILVLSGCLRSPLYNAKKLKPLTHETANYTQEQQQVVVHTSNLSDEKCWHLFDSYAKNLKVYNILPIQITIENHGNSCWTLTDKNIRLSKLDLDHVSEKLLNANPWRPPLIFFSGLVAAGLIAASPFIFFVAPALIAPTCICFYLSGFIISTCFIAAPILLTTSCIATYDAIDKICTKKQIRKDLADKKGSDCMDIKPGSRANILFFAQKDLLPKSYDIVLTDQTHTANDLIFDIEAK